MTFGEYIKNKRLKRNWSIRTTALKMGISPAYLVDVEKGNRYAFSISNLDLFAEIFDIKQSKSEYFYYLDLAAKSRNSIPVDVEKFLLENRQFIDFIRKINNKDYLSEDYINSLLKSVYILKES